MNTRPYKCYHECDCGDDDHTIYTDFDPDPVWDYFMVGVQLAPRWGFFKRVWIAFRYIFKPNEDKYSHWHTVELGTKGVEKLRDECNKFLTLMVHAQVTKQVIEENQRIADL